jgi:hypothetical protein
MIKKKAEDKGPWGTGTTPASFKMVPKKKMVALKAMKPGRVPVNGEAGHD